MIEPEIIEEQFSSHPMGCTDIDLVEGVESATQEQDDLCHGKVGEKVWYCRECDQFFDHPVKGPHPKPVREEEEDVQIPTSINRGMRRLAVRLQRAEDRQNPAQQQLVDVGVCQTCQKPFLEGNRCQCKPITKKKSKPGQASSVFVQMVKKPLRAAK